MLAVVVPPWVSGCRGTITTWCRNAEHLPAERLLTPDRVGVARLVVRAVLDGSVVELESVVVSGPVGAFGSSANIGMPVLIAAAPPGL